MRGQHNLQFAMALRQLPKVENLPKSVYHVLDEFQVVHMFTSSSYGMLVTYPPRPLSLIQLVTVHIHRSVCATWGTNILTRYSISTPQGYQGLVPRLSPRFLLHSLNSVWWCHKEETTHTQSTVSDQKTWSEYQYMSPSQHSIPLCCCC